MTSPRRSAVRSAGSRRRIVALLPVLLIVAASACGAQPAQRSPSAALPPEPLGAAALMGVTDPASAFTSSGPLVPDPALASEDMPTFYADGCQVRPNDSTVHPTCVYGVRGGRLTVGLFGDSKMGQHFPAIHVIADRERWRIELYLKSGCAFTYDGAAPDCEEFGKNVIRYLRQHGAPDIALVSQGSAETTALTTGMLAAIKDLRALGTRVVIVKDNPQPGMWGVPNCIVDHPDDYLACVWPRSSGTGTPALMTVARAAHLEAVSLNPWICPSGPDVCPPAIGGVLIYRQGSHLTASYVTTMAPMLHSLLAELGLTRDVALKSRRVGSGT